MGSGRLEGGAWCSSHLLQLSEFAQNLLSVVRRRIQRQNNLLPFFPQPFRDVECL
jgi:hypothetical protein